MSQTFVGFEITLYRPTCHSASVSINTTSARLSRQFSVFAKSDTVACWTSSFSLNDSRRQPHANGSEVQQTSNTRLDRVKIATTKPEYVSGSSNASLAVSHFRVSEHNCRSLPVSERGAESSRKQWDTLEIYPALAPVHECCGLAEETCVRAVRIEVLRRHVNSCQGDRSLVHIRSFMQAHLAACGHGAAQIMSQPACNRRTAPPSAARHIRQPFQHSRHTAGATHRHRHGCCVVQSRVCSQYAASPAPLPRARWPASTGYHCRYRRRVARATNGAASDNSSQVSLREEEQDDDNEMDLESKMEEFLRQQALAESGEAASWALHASMTSAVDCHALRPALQESRRSSTTEIHLTMYITGQSYVAPEAATSGRVLGAEDVTEQVCALGMSTPALGDPLGPYDSASRLPVASYWLALRRPPCRMPGSTAR